MSSLSSGGTISQGFAYAGHMTIKPGAVGLSAARGQVRHVAADLSFSSDEVADLLVAVGEALSNAYLHGSPDPANNLIYLGWRLAGEMLTITVKDEGDGFKPREAVQLSGAIKLGIGLRLMQQSVDQVHFEFDSGARVVLQKRVPSLRRPAA